MNLYLGNDYIRDTQTHIDNAFFLSFLPKADPLDVKIYLYALYLANSGKGADALERIALDLKLSQETVIAAFEYWDSKGVISLSRSPFTITFHPVKSAKPAIIRYNAEEFSSFAANVDNVSGKFYSEDEKLEFIKFVKEYNCEQDAFLLIVKHCVKSGRTSKNQIISFAERILKTAGGNCEKIDNALLEIEFSKGALAGLLSLAGSTSAPVSEEISEYLSWKNKLGFTDEALNKAASICKKGGFGALKRLIEELLQAKAFTISEIEEFVKNKTARQELAALIAKYFGGGFIRYDIVIESFIIPWEGRGYTLDALEEATRFAGASGIRTVETLNQFVENLFTAGIVTKDAVLAAEAREKQFETGLKEVMAACCVGNYIVYQSDKEAYKNIIEHWGFTHGEVMAAAALSKDELVAPFKYAIKLLSEAKSANKLNIEGIEEAHTKLKTKISQYSKPSKKPKDEYITRDNDFKDIFTKSVWDIKLKNENY
ncbi:MAG: hypothetical protein LBN25_02805 [Christensenellaceae bacterium]|jgi:hypothetical protein|nr:hypothetical protein [Christensenellaceae bacterium]